MKIAFVFLLASFLIVEIPAGAEGLPPKQPPPVADVKSQETSANQLLKEPKEPQKEPKQLQKEPKELQKEPKEFQKEPKKRSHQIIIKGEDDCYQVHRHKQTSPREGPAQRVRGPERTTMILESMASRKGQGLESLKLPPSLMKSFGKKAPPIHQDIKRGMDGPFSCPTAGSLSPCTCNEVTLTINCTGTGNFTKIKEIFNTAYFKDTSYATFFLYGMGEKLASETVLLNHTFGPVSFNEIIIESTYLHEVELDAFYGSEDSLQVISMQHNPHLHTFPFVTLHRFNELTELKLGYASLQVVPELKTVSKLEVLYLNANNINRIEPFAFAYLPVLETLDLGKNRLETIHDNEFSLCTTDVLIYLDENNLFNIEDKAFSHGQPSLLDMYFNQMTTLNNSIFQPIFDNIIGKEYDTYVNAEENPLCCKEIDWILEAPLYYELINLPEMGGYCLAVLQNP